MENTAPAASAVTPALAPAAAAPSVKSDKERQADVFRNAMVESSGVFTQHRVKLRLTPGGVPHTPLKAPSYSIEFDESITPSSTSSPVVDPSNSMARANMLARKQYASISTVLFPSKMCQTRRDAKMDQLLLEIVGSAQPK